MIPAASAPKPKDWRRLTQDVFAGVGVFATIIGVITGGMQLADYFSKRTRSAQLETPLVESKVRSEFTGQQSPPRTIVADQLVFGAGQFVAPDGSIWIANSVELAEGTAIKGRSVSIVARTIRGGSIDVSGKDGELNGSPGQSAGVIELAALSIENTRLIANGGQGAQGSRGDRGPNGRDGRCDGFGKYRGASAGGNGGPGGVGGAGGDGGVIRLAAQDPPSVQTSTVAGSGGKGGPGGPGGRGGRGCVGLGGSQSNRSDGNAGSVGDEGKRGADGRFSHVALPYAELRDVLATTKDPDEVRRRLFTQHPSDSKRN